MAHEQAMLASLYRNKKRILLNTESNNWAIRRFASFGLKEVIYI